MKSVFRIILTIICVLTSSCGKTDSFINYGELYIDDISVIVGKKVEINPQFTADSYPIEYSFQGNSIKIENNTVEALVANQTVTVTAKTEYHKTVFNVTTLETAGTVSFDNVNAFVGYPASDFYPTFSKPQFAEKFTYSYDKSALTIDEEKQTVSALKAGTYYVTATSENFSGSFYVYAKDVNYNATNSSGNVNYDEYNFSAQATDRQNQWNLYGNSGETTLFVGDSFFDTWFWSNFYTVSYPYKDALCLGIGSTTTYHWEVWNRTGWMKDINPKNIVMHIGTNNIYDDLDTVDEAVCALQRMFIVIHDSHPDTPIYWFGISQRSYDAAKINMVSQINSIMKKWCDQRSYITYIDTPPLLTNDMLKDTVHPYVDCYYVFVDELAKTDIEILPAGDAFTGDISFTTDQTISASTGVVNIKHKGETLSRNYVISGSLDITAITTNSHIQFGVVDSGFGRILLWDNESNGKFKLAIPYETNNIPAADIFTYTNGTTLTLQWKLVVTDDDAYFYVNNELKLVYTALGTGNEALIIGSEGTACKFYNISVKTMNGDADEYAAELANMSSVISQYGSRTTSEKIRV